MKKLPLLVCTAALSWLGLGSAQAQLVVSAPVLEGSSGVQLGLQSAMKRLERKANVLLGDGVVQQTLTKLRAIDNLNQHKRWYESLQQISNGVRTYRKVAGIFQKQNEIINLYSDAIMVFRQSPYIRPDQLSNMVTVYSKMLAESAKTVADLNTLLQPAALKMTDADRMQFIDGLDARLTKQAQLVSYYTQRNMQFIQENKAVAQDIAQLQVLLGRQ